MPAFMPKMLRSLAALLFVPMLLAPIAAQAQDSAATEQSAEDAAKAAERAARQAEKEAEKARKQQEKEAAQLQKDSEKEAARLEKEREKTEKDAEKERKKEQRAAEKAAKDAAKAAQGGKGATLKDAAMLAAEAVQPPTPDKADPDNILYLDLSTGGRVSIQLYPEIAPNHVERIKTLTRQGFYNGIIFHRVIEGFMAQTGDPTGTGTGGSDLPDVAAEFNKFPHLRGSLSMARAQDPNSANSQFFIVFYPRFSLDNSYTNFGRVFSGMEYVDVIPRGEPPTAPARILQASLKSQNLPEPNYAAAAQPAERAISVDDLNAPIRN
jgi:cyclophilin family peptidyl-prolyl cis-trans isomerase/Skp family chaperone for outer membrane proteins